MATTNVEIANTILAQLGGGKALMLMGAQRPVAIDNGVQIKIGRNPKGINTLRITLDPSDTYTVRVSRCAINRTTYTVKETSVRSMDDVYADSLMDVVESLTGLYLTFSPRR